MVVDGRRGCWLLVLNPVEHLFNVPQMLWLTVDGRALEGANWLTLTLPRAAEAQPKKITVTAS